MIITKFNNYFDKHGKATYLVLCIIIAIIFVFTVGAGDSSCTGQERLTSIGSMYGRNLATDDIMKQTQQIRLYAYLNGQRIPSQTNDFELIQMVLEKIRLVKYAEDNNMDEITDEQLATAIVELPYWKSSDKDHSGNELDSTETGYSQKRFAFLLENTVKNNFGLTGEDFDVMMRNEILAQRVLDNVVKDIKADDKTVKLVAANSTLKIANFSLNLENDSKPAAADIDAFLKNRANELTDQDKMTNFFVVAYRDFEDIEKAAEKDKKLAAEITPADAEIKAFFDKNAATVFKGKKLEDVKEQIVKTVKASKIEAWLQAKFKAFSAEIAKPVPAKSTRFAQFRTAAAKNSLKIANQNGLPEGSFVSGIVLQQKALVEAIKNIKEMDKPTALVPIQGNDGDNGFAIAAKVDNPNKANNMRNAAADILRGEKALVMFQEKIVKPYAEVIKNVKTIDELYESQMKKDGKQSLIAPATFEQFVTDIDRLNNTILPFFKEADGKVVIETPAKTDKKLLDWYKREVAIQKAKERAEKALADLNKAIKEGKTLEQADAQKRFIDVKTPVAWFKAIESYQQMMFQQMYMSQRPMTPMMQRNIMFYAFSMAGNSMGVAAKNLPALVAELDKTADKTLLPKPYQTSTGYALVYQVARALPTDEEGKKQVEYATTMVESQLKSDAIQAFKADLEAKSNTRLVPEILPQSAE